MLMVVDLVLIPFESKFDVTTGKNDEHAEYDESNTHVLERFNNFSCNPVEEDSSKLNLPDHRKLKDGGEEMFVSDDGIKGVSDGNSSSVPADLMMIINLWRIVQQGNSPKRLGKDAKGNTIVHPPVSLDEHVAVQRENKDIWSGKFFKARFGGNEESKKMRKTMLKQQFTEFSVTEEEGLHKGYDSAGSKPNYLISSDLLFNQFSDKLVCSDNIMEFGDGRNALKVANGYALLERLKMLQMSSIADILLGSCNVKTVDDKASHCGSKTRLVFEQVEEMLAVPPSITGPICPGPFTSGNEKHMVSLLAVQYRSVPAWSLLSFLQCESLGEYDDLSFRRY
ncbi:hypothetical protein Tco_0651470 [Tanacetum coccineum]|uniref:Uncharacterized protein n=1 Tax=Tanacetum coccineum TaxID=301880 RepID=A0ABQ4WVJ9_9ASTR